MTARLLDGNALLEATKVELAARIEALLDRGVTPGLGTLLVGDDPNSAAYVERKHRNCEEMGIVSFHQTLPATASQEEVHATIRAFNDDPQIDAFLVQLPLPQGLDEEAALLTVNPDKDVDGLHPVNLGRLAMGADAPRACTPAGIQALLVRSGVPIEGRHVVIVGRGLTIGRPLGLLLSLKRPNANAAVTVVHTAVADLAAFTRQADILVAAAGSPSMITPDMVKPGAAVVAAGITWAEGRRLLSDVDESVAEVAGWITPRIGGVGPTTIAMLLSNAVAAAERWAGSP
ncbi:MAG: bifunctional 5,10-methylenetetrahydrofolate dehydrogenase/5,10-methenyltetrahydrofolate cyclohydrolase [Actinomycetota bacterium]|nr:bifunctional 5,10-methylenetetrahydrofolate dehydrogenase/5,10-methenyltetrahydrofolate cyclohydrolase [Actinomycetota bacterium]MDQ3680209.1 bifunctional 5,10-methylenetetrahydrofolate dehydrogenase/5,10-methenyltetrahydrofolate cyclohydrolase [Actinomycetota bacterium]